MLEGALGAECGITTVATRGDNQKVSLANLKGGFTESLEMALLAEEIDLAVHSLKDMPARLGPPFELAMLLPRGEVADVLIADQPLEKLRKHAVIGTGSLRRRAQLRLLRDDLTAAELRGNVNTRLAKRGQYDGIVLAACGLTRLGVNGLPRRILPPTRIIPAPGQGIIAVEGLKARSWREALSGLDNQKSRREATAERAFVAELGATCQTPVGAWADAAGAGGEIELRVFVGDYQSGQRHFRKHRGSEPRVLGGETAKALLGQASEEFWRLTLGR